MKNQSVSDYVSSAMDEILNSAEHKALFGQVKTAQDLNAAKAKECCEKCKKEECECVDSAMADDNDAHKKAKKKEEDEKKSKESKESKESDSSKADDELSASAAYDIAIDSLLTASAALDTVGLPRSSTFALKIASFVVDAKKKEKDSKKSKKKDTKKSDSKKDTKKSDKKTNPFAKKKDSDKKSSK